MMTERVLIENVEWLRDNAVGPASWPRQLGLTSGALIKRLQRAGRSDLAGLLTRGKVRA